MGDRFYVGAAVRVTNEKSAYFGSVGEVVRIVDHGEGRGTALLRAWDAPTLLSAAPLAFGLSEVELDRGCREWLAEEERCTERVIATDWESGEGRCKDHINPWMPIPESEARALAGDR